MSYSVKETIQVKQYKFNLESVLKYRAQVESLKKKELGIILDKIHNEEDNIRKLEESYHGETKAMLQKEVMDSNEIMLYNQYLSGIKRLIEAGKKELFEWRKRGDSKRQELIDALMEKKILLDLKEKQQKEYIKQEEKTELSLLDEHSVAVFGKGKGD